MADVLTTLFEASDRLKRFLYMNNQYVYINGNPESHLDNCPNNYVLYWARGNVTSFLNILKEANDDPLLVRRSNIFYILAKALRFENLGSDEKLQIKNSVLPLVQSDQDFFDFIKYFSLGREADKQKISNSVKKLVIAFYKSKKCSDWIQSLVQQESYHGWSHKDLIKLSHFKPDNIEIIPIINYILFGIKKLDFEDSEKNHIVVKLKNLHELKTTSDPSRAVELMKQFKISVNHLNSSLLKNDTIWAAAIPTMPLRELLQNLPRLYKAKLLKTDTATFKKLNEVLSNLDNIKTCNFHPVELYIYRKLFQKRGKQLDRKLLEHLVEQKVKEKTLQRLTSPEDVKCKDVVDKMTKCLVASYKGMTPCGKKILITIDTSQNADDRPYKQKISVYEAIFAITSYFTRVEKTENVTVAVFDNDSIKVIDLTKCKSTNKAIRTLKKNKSSYIIPGAPIKWADEQNKQIDIFINFMDRNWATALPEEKKDVEDLTMAILKYRIKTKLPEAKLVQMFVDDGAPVITANKYRNILIMNGFSTSVPKILEAFCHNKFM